MHLFLGSGTQARRMYRELARAGGDAVVIPRSGPECHPIRPGTAIPCCELNAIAEQCGARSIAVAEADFARHGSLSGALMDCKLRGFEIRDAAELCERLSWKLWLQRFRPDLAVFATHFRKSQRSLALKRVVDIVLAAAVGVAAAPVLLLAAAAVRAESRGPVFLRQERLGLHGRRFRVCKFRTMRSDAEAATGPVWASAEDPRITRVGKWLRKYRVDEVPQIFNVLMGDMSFVGPRPERPHFVDILRQHIGYYDLRHYVKPGITGWAQVMYSYGASVEDAYEKLQYDLYYLKHMSFSVDLKILARTVLVVLQGRGR
jgi:exopolysaccharide biosynthesis polyprenyl glycosylphosphotransferase